MSIWDELPAAEPDPSEDMEDGKWLPDATELAAVPDEVLLSLFCHFTG